MQNNPLILNPPSIDNDDDFNDALKTFNGIHDKNNEIARSLGNSIVDYNQKQLLTNGISPAAKFYALSKKRKLETLDALARDWNEFPEAKEKAKNVLGAEYVKQWEEADEEDRRWLGGNKLLELMYSKPGDNDADSRWRYNDINKTGVLTTPEIWSHYLKQRAPIVEAEKKARETAKSFADKSPSFFEAMVSGASCLEALEKVEGLTEEEKNFAIENCGMGSQWAKSIQNARDWANSVGVPLKFVSEEDVKAKADELKANSGGKYSGVVKGRGLVVDHTKLAREKLGDNQKGIIDVDPYKAMRSLDDLRKKDPMAFDILMGAYQLQATRTRNDGTAIVSPFARTMGNMFDSVVDFSRHSSIGDLEEGDTIHELHGSGDMPVYVVRDKNGKYVDRTARTQERAELMSSIKNIRAQIAESPDGAGAIRRLFDGLGKMSAQTAMFLGTRGVGTFAALSSDRYNELRGDGIGEFESILRGGIAGATEVAVERIGGESLFRTVKLMRGIPGISRFAGYAGGFRNALSKGMYGNAALRFGAASAAAGGSEWMEEFIQPTLQAPMDAALARLFGSGNGMTVQDWKDQIAAAADPELGLQMLVFGAVAGGAQIPAFAREAKISRITSAQIMGVGIDKTEADRLADMVDPVEKARGIFEAIQKQNDRNAQLRNIQEGFKSMKDDYSWLSQSKAYQAEVELLNLPKVEDLGDGQWRFSTGTKINGTTEWTSVELGEKEATARMQELLSEGIRQRMIEAANDFSVEKLIGKFAGTGRFVFEDMGEAETVETARKLADAARLRIDEGANPNDQATDLGTQMTYQQAISNADTLQNRIDLAVERGEIKNADNAASRAYRVAMRNGQTLIRYYKGEVTTTELLEEVLETHLIEDMGNTQHGIDWYAENIRKTQDYLHEMGYLKPGEDLLTGEVTKSKVIEAMSMLAKGDILYRANTMNIPQWLKDFLMMVRQWVSSAKALLDLGNGIHELETRRKAGEAVPVGEDFIKTVYNLSGHVEQYWLREGEEQGRADANEIIKEVGGNKITYSVMALDNTGKVLSPDTFVTRPDGATDWFMIPSRKGQKEMPVRLLIGEDRRKHKGYGLTHIAASRDLDGLWANTSPEKYLSSILANASELWELAPGRELLVRGKRPSSWMALQLVAKDGYYSIITAYSVKQNKKPKGKKIPLAEQTSDKNQREARHRQHPANSDAAPSAFPGGQENKAATLASTAGRGLTLSLPQGTKSVNINDVTLHFDDGGTMPASFSISENLNSLVNRATIDRIAPLKVVDKLASEIQSDLATWGRYNGETDQEQFYASLGRNMTLLKTALMYLPVGKRGRIKPIIDRVQILTELATTGKIDKTADINSAARREIKRGISEAISENREDMEVTAGIASNVAGRAANRAPINKVFNQTMLDQIDEAKQAWAEGKLKDLIESTLEDATEKLNQLAREDMQRNIQDMLESVLSVKVKKGKRQKGKISYEAYSYLSDHVVPLLNMTAEAKESEIKSIASEIDRIEKENPDQMDDATQAELDDLRDDLVRVELYGNIKGMDAGQLAILSDNLRDYIRKERETWKANATAKREARKAVFRKIVSTFDSSGKKVHENSLREANEEYKRTWSALKNLPDFVENMDNLLNRLENITGIKDFMKAMRSRQTEAFTAMWADKDQRGKDVQAIYDKVLTEKFLKRNNMKSQVAWMTWFKESHDTGIRKTGKIRQNVNVAIETARELRDMTEKERSAWADRRWETGQEYISMTTIDEIINKLNKYEEETEAKKAEGKHPRVRSHISAMTEYDAVETPSLVLSRDNALYIILQCEQPDQAEKMRIQGYTPEVVDQLRKYVGKEGYEIGRMLRDLLKKQGDKIAEPYQREYGVPFPRVENYYPARYVAADRMTDEDAADIISGVPTTKGQNTGWMKQRTDHNRTVDTSVGALSIFWEATDLTDNWYHMHGIIEDWRALLRDKAVAESLLVNLGKGDLARLRRWVDLLERAGKTQGQSVGHYNNLFNRLMSGQSKAILAFRIETLMKQLPGVLNAWIGAEGIGFMDYVGTIAKMRNNIAKMSVWEMYKRMEIDTRKRGDLGKIDTERMSKLGNDEVYSFAEAANMFGMDLMDHIDAYTNAVGSAALWNIKYTKAKKAGMSEELAKDEAWAAVRQSLHSAQPIEWSDKSFGQLNRGAFGHVLFYMMSENFNKTAKIYGLFKQGKWKKALQVWFVYGFANALIGAMIDFMKDDPDEWDERTFWGYLGAALAGPVSGMPLIGEGFEYLASQMGMKVYTGSAGRALIDVKRGWRAGEKLFNMATDDKDYSSGDFIKQTLRLGSFFGVVGGALGGYSSKTMQTMGQYLTLTGSLMNPVKTATEISESHLVN